MPRKKLVWKAGGIRLTENQTKEIHKQVCGKILAQFPPK
jgi:hypothetical protein